MNNQLSQTTEQMIMNIVSSSASGPLNTNGFKMISFDGDQMHLYTDAGDKYTLAVKKGKVGKKK